MDLFIQGIKSDISLELPEVEKFYQEYKELNTVFIENENKYEDVLTNYGTEDLKFALGFLSSIYKNIEKQGYQVINAVFDATERYGEYELSVFYGNRILEKYSEASAEDILIRIETLRRVLSALLNLDDKLFFSEYLIKYTKELENLLSLYPSYIKEIYSHISDWYQFMYFYSLTITGDDEKAFGFLLKSYQIRKHMLEEGMSDIITGNNILYIANIIGLYSQLKDTILSLAFSPEEYVEEFLKEVKQLKSALDKKPSRKEFFLKGYFRRYYNELLTNIYVLGFHDEHREIIEVFPEIVNKDHLIMVEIDKLFKEIGEKEPEEIRKKVSSLKREIDILFNNISRSKQEQILYLYYNLLIEIEENLENLLQEIKTVKEKKFRSSLLFDMLQIKVFLKQEKTEEARDIALKVREKAIIENNRFIIDAVNRILDEIN